MFSFRSIRFQIILSFVLTTCFLAAIAFFLVNNTRNTNLLFGRFLSADTPRIITLLEIKNASKAVQAGVAQFQGLDSADTHFENSAASQVKFALLAAIAQMKSLQEDYLRYTEANDIEDQEFLMKLSSHENHIIDLSLRLFELRERDANDPLITALLQELIEAGNAMDVLINDFVSVERKEIEETQTQVEATFQETFLISIILFSFLLLFIIAMQLYISRLIFRPLQKLQRMAGRMAAGDWDARIDIDSQDEMGRVGRAFNVMAEYLEESYRKVEKESEVEKARVHELTEKNTLLEETKRAMLNILEDERMLEEKLEHHAQELEQANQKTEAILRFLKSIGEGVFATDGEGRVIFMNEAAEVMAGKTFAQAENKTAEAVFHFIQVKQSEEISLSLVPLALKKEHPVSFPNQSFLLQKKKKVPVSGICSLIRDPEGKIIGTISVLQDITKKHELDQMKDSFLSVAAHQLRTPLGSMRWSMELLLGGDLGRIPKDAKDAVKQIYENSDRMITLVNDLLNVSRIDQNRGIEKKEPVNIVTVLENAIRSLAPEAEKNSISIDLEIKDKPIPALMAPPKHLHEAFENLVSNGIKYNKPGGKVVITVTKNEKAVFVTVADTGIGIPKADQSKIFSKFFRASNAVLKQTDGSGLGLSVVKSYLEEADARISFESEENQGSTFSIKFPFNPTDS